MGNGLVKTAASSPFTLHDHEDRQRAFTAEDQRWLAQQKMGLQVAGCVAASHDHSILQKVRGMVSGGSVDTAITMQLWVTQFKVDARRY